MLGQIVNLPNIRQRKNICWLFQTLSERHILSRIWWEQIASSTDGFAEGSVGPRPCGNWNIFLAGSGQWGPIAIQPKGDPKCHRCVCG
jgi:hypothetical protein